MIIIIVQRWCAFVVFRLHVLSCESSKKIIHSIRSEDFFFPGTRTVVTDFFLPLQVSDLPRSVTFLGVSHLSGILEAFEPAAEGMRQGRSVLLTSMLSISRNGWYSKLRFYFYSNFVKQAKLKTSDFSKAIQWSSKLKRGFSLNIIKILSNQKLIILSFSSVSRKVGKHSANLIARKWTYTIFDIYSWIMPVSMAIK